MRDMSYNDISALRSRCRLCAGSPPGEVARPTAIRVIRGKSPRAGMVDISRITIYSSPLFSWFALLRRRVFAVNICSFSNI
jgi:hypothetical protein